MTTTMSIRELTRSGGKLGKFDYIDIEDRKSHEYKGLFVPAKYADDVKRFLEKKLAEEKRERIDEIMQFAGTVKIEERFVDKSMKEIREMIAGEKYGK
jgi:hypothetical protein